MMDIVGVIPCKGFSGKSRLLRKNGGQFTDAQRKEIISSLTEDAHRTVSSCDLINSVVLAVPHSCMDKEFVEFCKQLGVTPIQVGGATFTEQVKEVRQSLGLGRTIVLFANDLPLATTADLREVLEVQADAVVVASRRLGCAVVVLRPDTTLALSLGETGHNLLANATESGVEVIYNYNLYFDLDEPEDVRETYELLRLRKRQGSSLLAALRRHKWEFLVPQSGTQDLVLTELERLFSEGADVLEELTRHDCTIHRGAVSLMSVTSRTGCHVYLTCRDLMPELRRDLDEKGVAVTHGFTFDARELLNGPRDRPVRVCVYGVPCGKAARSLGRIIKRRTKTKAP